MCTVLNAAEQVHRLEVEPFLKESGFVRHRRKDAHRKSSLNFGCGGAGLCLPPKNPAFLLNFACLRLPQPAMKTFANFSLTKC